MSVRRVVGLLILLCAFQSSRTCGQVVATWTTSSGNYSNAANWSTLTVPSNGGGTYYNAVINGTGADTVTFDASGTVINSLTIGNGETFKDNGLAPTLTVGDPTFPKAGSITNNGTINWGSGSTVTLDITAGNGSITNNGTINLTGSRLRFDDSGNGNTLTLSGGGTINASGAFISGNTTFINNGSTIQGSVFIQADNVINTAGGTIDANGAGQRIALPLVNLTNTGGTLEATNGGILALDFTHEINNKNGTIASIGPGSVVEFNSGSRIDGGTLTTAGGGFLGPLGHDFGIQLDGSTQGPLTLSTGSTWNSTTSSTTFLGGTYINNGNMLFGGGSDELPSMFITGNTTLKGTGSVTLAPNGDGLASIAPGGSVTLTNQSIIQGAGTIVANCTCAPSGGALAIINEGLIDANLSGQTLSISPTGLQNIGTLRVESGSTMILDTVTGFVTSTGDVNVKNGGTMTLASGLNFIQSAGRTTIENGGLMQGGNFLATGGSVTVNGTLNPTVLEIESGARLRGTGTIIGNVGLGGTVMPGAPGTPGTLTILGNYEQFGNGTFDELINANSASFLNVSGNVALDDGSFLKIMLLNGYDPLGQTFSIMDYGSLVGQFSNGSSFWQDGFLWDISYGQHEIDVTAVRAPERSSLLLLFLGLAALAFSAQQKIRKANNLA